MYDYFLFFLIPIVIIWHTYSLAKRRLFNVFDPLNAFWAGMLVVYFLQPIDFYDVFVSWYGRGAVQYAAFVSLLSVLCVIWGYESKLSYRVFGAFPIIPSKVSPDHLLWGGWLLVAIGAAAYAVIISEAGGIDAWLAIGQAKSAESLVSSYTFLAAQFWPLGVTLLIFRAEYYRSPPLGRIIVWSAAIFLIFFFVYIGSRSRLITFTIVLFSAYYLPRRTNPPLKIILPAFLVVLIAVNYIAAYRQGFVNLSITTADDTQDEVLDRVLPTWLGGSSASQSRFLSRGMEYSCVIASVSLVPDDVDFNYGYSELEFVTRVIPRSLWPDKIYPHYEAFTPIYKKAGLSYSYVEYSKVPILMGPAMTFVGHWWAVGGYFTLVIMGYGAGILYRSIRLYYDHYGSSLPVQVLYISVIPIGFIDAAATPLFWIFQVPFIVIPLLIIFRMSGKGISCIR